MNLVWPLLLNEAALACSVRVAPAVELVARDVNLLNLPAVAFCLPRLVPNADDSIRARFDAAVFTVSGGVFLTVDTVD